MMTTWTQKTHWVVLAMRKGEKWKRNVNKTEAKTEDGNVAERFALGSRETKGKEDNRHMRGIVA